MVTAAKLLRDIQIAIQRHDWVKVRELLRALTAWIDIHDPAKKRGG